MNDRVFAVIGGDIRFSRVIERLCQDGYPVYAVARSCCGNIGNAVVCDLQTAMTAANFVLLPIPALREGQMLNLSENPISEEVFCGYVRKGQTIFGGKLSENFCEKIREVGGYPLDYLTNESMTVQNAMITAEGAVSLAMQQRKETIFGSRCLIMGYGRIGKILSRYLHFMGASVTVCARKESDRTWAKLCGYDAISPSMLSEEVRSADILFNTVPHMIFDASVLQFVQRRCFIVDLASKPGGVDLKAAADYGLTAVQALSLPGKTAPISAGDILYQTVLSMISERSQQS